MKAPYASNKTTRTRRSGILRGGKKRLLKNGFLIHIGWHYGKNTMVAEYTHPSGFWEAVYAGTVRELIGKIRLGIAEMENPEVKRVRQRVTGY